MLAALKGANKIASKQTEWNFPDTQISAHYCVYLWQCLQPCHNDRQMTQEWVASTLYLVRKVHNLVWFYPLMKYKEFGYFTLWAGHSNSWCFIWQRRASDYCNPRQTKSPPTLGTTAWIHIPRNAHEAANTCSFCLNQGCGLVERCGCYQQTWI